jgi:hypothetical protein
MDLADVSPINQRIASTMLDLPHPLGPTIPVKAGIDSYFFGFGKGFETGYF